jgi:hypothetical protein
MVSAAVVAWALQSSTITYHVSHPLHQVEAVTHAARGRATCSEGRCEVLVAVEVKTFDSGDTNRDLHTIQVVKGGLHPLVVVHASVPDKAAADVAADVQVELAGSTATYKSVPFKRSEADGSVRLKGTIPLNIKDFKIEPPSLLTVPIKDSVPVDVDTTWRRR